MVLAKESVPDPERKAALGAVICRGVRITRRFNIFTLVSLRLYETGVLSFSRDGALRRSAYRGGEFMPQGAPVFTEENSMHPNLA